MRRISGRLAVSIGVLLLAGLVLATAAGAGKSRIYGIQDCGEPNVKPKRIVFACADAGLYANHFDWKHWGRRHATSDGVMHAKICKPNCAGGYFKDYPATFTERHIRTVRCGGGRLRLYTKVKVEFPGAHPPGVEDGSFKQFCT